MHDYQRRAVSHILQHEGAGVILDMGLGKTVITLTALDYLLYKDMSIERVLVIAPKRVAEDTWPCEASAWAHLQHLRISTVLGSAAKREKALNTPADIYVTNRENVKWLVSYYGKKWPFDCVVIDELSSFKDSSSQRFKALRKVRPFVKRIVGLTGTPSPNGLIDLWAQVYLLDGGERLGSSLTKYRQTYFVPGRTNGQVVFDYRLRVGAAKIIHQLISDICISMSAEEYLKMPDRMDIVRPVTLSESMMKQYRTFEKEQVMQIDTDNISAANAAALTGKLLQYANGAIYDEEKEVHLLHDAKLDALEGIVEEAHGENVLVFYNYKHDLDRLLKRFEKLQPRVLNDANDKNEWNAGKIRMLLAHPASCAYGLNLQAGGAIIVWFGLNWSLELYEQANARLYRQGQSKSVKIYHLVATGTVDENVMKALSSKEAGQTSLKKAIRERQKLYDKIYSNGK